ncbi:VWA domain-containing protein [Chitinophaga barathri]|uniref:VWA domain-containing protein n=1 Tax=Chitinophaga barathri TaxID=1647451 RepID=A0A3N4M771_9BACT|nr:VWA domain-containing protein [Chitinophaga barathri]RPD39015.1 VWA domain-containing protein [Chitinophaga barathri]
MNFSDYTNIDWHQFHFLRPAALYLLIPLAVIAVLLALGNRERTKWKQFIIPQFRRYMFSPGNRRAVILPLVLFIVGITLIIVGVAGPTWKKIEVPGQKVQAVVMVVMDLSKSMLAKDIPPGRLERAKLKLSDFLDAKPGAATGLLAYAGTPHLVLPFTSDYALIKFQAGSLDNWEMPVQGRNTELMMRIVDTLMQPILAPSHIVLMTDSISSTDAGIFENYAASHIHKLEVLLVSPASAQGVPLHNKNINVTPVTLDTTDVGSIAGRVRDQLIFEKDEKKDDRHWQDMGYLLILPALLIALYWFRKGWAIQWCWAALMLALGGCSVNSREADWWYTKDYQAQVLYNEGKYTEAADRFKDLPHKGVAYYKAGDYEAAAEVFALDTTAAGQYNRGLSLTKLGKYDEAMEAFSLAEQKDSSFKRLAEAGKQHLNVTKVETDSVMRYDKKSDSVVKKAQGKDSLKERKPTAQDQKLASETQVKDLPKSGDRLTEEVKSNIHEAHESDDPPSGDSTGKAGKPLDMKNLILRKPPADPGMFLHKRFVLQQKRYYKNIKP